MSERCEPTPEWRHMRWHMLEADVEPLGWWPPKTAVWQAPAAWMGDTLGWSNDFGLGFDGPEEAAEKGWRYIAPVTPPATIAALVVALEAVSVLDLNARMPDDVSSSLEQAGITALALYRGEAGR